MRRHSTQTKKRDGCNRYAYVTAMSTKQAKSHHKEFSDDWLGIREMNLLSRHTTQTKSATVRMRVFP